MTQQNYIITTMVSRAKNVKTEKRGEEKNNLYNTITKCTFAWRSSYLIFFTLKPILFSTVNYV